MLKLKSSIQSLLPLRRCFASKTKLTGGDLFTWGNSWHSLGYNKNENEDSLVPKKVDCFDGNVIKVSMGINHTGVVTNEGHLYTFGKGTYGILGHNDKNFNHIKPKLVQFFKQKKLKVIDVVCGEKFTIALTDDGDVWSWGLGKVKNSFLSKFLPTNSNTLGQGYTTSRFKPFPIEALRKWPPISQIVAGNKFCFAFSVRGNLYFWGKADYGVSGDGHTKDQTLPVLNEHLRAMRLQNGMKIKKIKALNSKPYIQSDNGTVWSWGENNSGQLAIGSEFESDFESIVNLPTKIEGFGKERVIDFDIGESVSAFLTDQNKVYWSGLKLSTKPEIMKIPVDYKIKSVACSNNSVCALTIDNHIFMKNNFLKHNFEDNATGILMGDTQIFQSRKILELGGSYSNKYAIVQKQNTT